MKQKLESYLLYLHSTEMSDLADYLKPDLDDCKTEEEFRDLELSWERMLSFKDFEKDFRSGGLN